MLGASHPSRNANLVLFTLALGGALLFAGCTAPTDDNEGQELVEMVSGLRFDPETLTVDPGTEVVWINRDSIQHNVVSDDGSFDGMDENDLLNGGQRFSFTFDEPGTYPYHCAPHAFQDDDGNWQGMVGTIIVRNTDGTVPTGDTGGDNGTGNESA